MLTFDFKNLEPVYLKVFRIVSSLTFFLIAIGPTILLSVAFDFRWYFIAATYVGIFSLLFSLFYWYSIHWFKAYQYQLSEAGLSIKKGVFWQQQSMIPRNRVQHIDITTGPIERRYDLSKLVVHTAGTRNASVTLPGLLHDDAVALRHELINTNHKEDTV